MNTICEEHLDIIHVQEACNVCRPYAKSQGAWSSSWPCMAMHGKATTTTNNKTSRNKHQQSLSPAPTYHNQRHHRCTKSPSHADPATPPPRSSPTTHKLACLCPNLLPCTVHTHYPPSTHIHRLLANCFSRKCEVARARSRQALAANTIEPWCYAQAAPKGHPPGACSSWQPCARSLKPSVA